MLIAIRNHVRAGVFVFGVTLCLMSSPRLFHAPVGQYVDLLPNAQAPAYGTQPRRPSTGERTPSAPTLLRASPRAAPPTLALSTVDDVLLLQAVGLQGLRTRLNNIEYFPPNFEGLVLGCIDADFCK